MLLILEEVTADGFSNASEADTHRVRNYVCNTIVSLLDELYEEEEGTVRNILDPSASSGLGFESSSRSDSVASPSWGTSKSEKEKAALSSATTYLMELLLAISAIPPELEVLLTSFATFFIFSYWFCEQVGI